MRILKTSSFTKPTMKSDGELTKSEFNRLIQYMTNLDSDTTRLFQTLQGAVTLGTAVNAKPGENIFGQWRIVADTGTINTEFSVTHSLSDQGIALIPGNYLITSINKGGVVYTSGTTWTTTTAYFKCSVANAAVNIFLMR